MCASISSLAPVDLQEFKILFTVAVVHRFVAGGELGQLADHGDEGGLADAGLRAMAQRIAKERPDLHERVFGQRHEFPGQAFAARADGQDQVPEPSSSSRR
jgi:hypothetical protein